MPIAEVTVSEIMNRERMLDANQSLKVASIIASDPSYNRPPDYWINIFNISQVEMPGEPGISFVRHRPTDFPTLRIRRCPPGQPWVLALRVGNIVHYKIPAPDTGQVNFASIDGERWATDLINPANLGRSMWTNQDNSDMDQMHGGSDDLSRRGVFWSLKVEPTAEELAKARARMEKHYRQEVQKAEDLARAGKISEIGSEAHAAADYFRESYGWHVKTSVLDSCPNCGEPIKSGIAYHQSPLGLCVLDWKRTVAAGVRTKADVPEDQKWWADEPPKSETREEKLARLKSELEGIESKSKK